jgi:two-component system, chemotaxis family, protein-glutamate methylesterase/glutaminase
MIRVLVIDDSAVMRSFLAGIVESQPDMEVAGVVSDPVLAMDRIRRNPPDVITLDVEMPRMNGLDFLRNLMTVRPLPVVMISSLTRDGEEATMKALEFGAVDFVPKPASPDEFHSVAPDIAEKIRAASQARVVRRLRPHIVAVDRATKRHDASPPTLGTIIGIGASTGGVEALREILPRLPADMPPILVAQHMLPGFTAAFARRLDGICEISVKEADHGEVALRGMCYIAPGGRHLSLVRRAASYVLRVSDEPPVNRHRPSVEMLFTSMAEAAGADAVALLLTGMGADGAQALLTLRTAGAATLAQDEATSVVFGMPRQAIALGAATEVVALGEIAQRLQYLARARTQRAPGHSSSSSI